MMEVRISRILAPAYGYQPHHKRFKERHSYPYHYLPLSTTTYHYLLTFLPPFLFHFSMVSRHLARVWSLLILFMRVVIVAIVIFVL